MIIDPSDIQCNTYLQPTRYHPSSWWLTPGRTTSFFQCIQMLLEPRNTLFILAVAIFSLISWLALPLCKLGGWNRTTIRHIDGNIRICTTNLHKRTQQGRNIVLRWPFFRSGDVSSSLQNIYCSQLSRIRKGVVDTSNFALQYCGHGVRLNIIVAIVVKFMPTDL